MPSQLDLSTQVKHKCFETVAIKLIRLKNKCNHSCALCHSTHYMMPVNGVVVHSAIVLAFKLLKSLAESLSGCSLIQEVCPCHSLHMHIL